VGFSLQPGKKLDNWQDELESSVKYVKSRKNILVVGPEKIGKSSFLFSLRDKVSEIKSFVPILFLTDKCIDLASYIRRNLLRVFSAYGTIFGSKPEEFFSLSMIDADRRISELKLGDSAKESLKILLFFEHDDKIDVNDAVKAFFSFPSLVAKETKTTAVVMIDDADKLSEMKSDKVSLSFSPDSFTLDAEENVVLVISSSTNMALDGFEEIVLGPLSLDSTRRFFEEGKMDLGEPAVNTLYNITGGVPFYLNFIGRFISRSGTNDTSSINTLFEDMLSNELHVYFRERIKLLSPKELPILLCMAEHKVNSPSRISKLISYSQTNVRRFLSIMEEKGFVTLKERGVFEIHDPVFRRWLEMQAKA